MTSQVLSHLTIGIFTCSLAACLVAGVAGVPTGNPPADVRSFHNRHGQTEFLVAGSGHTLLIPNHHKESQNQLKLSINGPSVDSVVSTVKNETESWGLVLSDKSRVDFDVNGLHGENITEYSLNWHGGGANTRDRALCLNYENDVWFSTYQSSTPAFPINNHQNHTFGPLRFNSMLDYNQAGSAEFYRIVEHLFLGTSGFALMLDPTGPWFLARTQSGLCFSVNNSIPYNGQAHDSSYLDIKIRLFASTNIRTVSDYVVHKSGLIQGPRDVPPYEMFRDPSWATYNLGSTIQSHAQIVEYAGKIQKYDFGKGEIMIDEKWFDNYGNYTFGQLHSAQEMIRTVHRLGMNVRVHIFPLAIEDKAEPKSADYFVKWTANKHNSWFVDFSQPEASSWFVNKLTQLKKDSHLDGFRIAGEVLADSSFLVKDPVAQRTPNLLITKYIESVAALDPKRSVTDLGFKTQHLPTFVRLSNFHQTSSNAALASLVVNILSVSMAGYGFVEPYQIGGFDLVPSAELYIRWVQAVALMPRITFSYPPWMISGNSTLNITRKFVTLHQAHSTTIVELAKRRVLTGEPILRPMWYAEPNDPRSYKISDQFMLGSDIVVAPILASGQLERSVYLPNGIWIDQHGKRFQGPAVLNKVHVPLEELAYYKRAV